MIIKALIQKKDYLCSVFVGNFGGNRENLYLTSSRFFSPTHRQY